MKARPKQYGTLHINVTLVKRVQYLRENIHDNLASNEKEALCSLTWKYYYPIFSAKDAWIPQRRTWPDSPSDTIRFILLVYMLNLYYPFRPAVAPI